MEQSRGKEPRVYDDVDVDDDASEGPRDDESSSAAFMSIAASSVDLSAANTTTEQTRASTLPNPLQSNPAA